jgi:transglutaminase-like putative cysteine protease
MSALDTVEGDYVLTVYDTSRREVSVGGSPVPERDPFWGSIAVELAGSKPIAIPSVAADMRFLSYETEPRTDLVFSKDGADNYYVEAADGRSTGQVRVVFLVDAPASYFAPTIPHGLTVAEAAARNPAHPLPARMQKAADTVMARIGINATMPLDEAIDRLVAYHRAFEAGDPPPHTDDIYRDLALAQRGVCRHRAFTFVITAWALGLQARFLANEAHAWVELYLPEAGWARIDLGGAALNMDVANAEDKQMYRPRAEDPFPKPPEYADNYTQLRGDIRGLTAGQLAQAQGSGSGSGSGSGGGSGSLLGHATDPVTPAPGEGLPAPSPDAYAGKAPTRVAVDAVDGDAIRGDRVKVKGRLTDGGGVPLPHQRITIFFKPTDGSGAARRVGEGRTADDGSYVITVDLPDDLALGNHEVYGSFAGNARLQPALSP